MFVVVVVVVVVLFVCLYTNETLWLNSCHMNIESSSSPILLLYFLQQPHDLEYIVILFLS